MYNGVVNVYKEKDFTSFDVVAKLRGVFGQKKIGHTGTLDPMAEGVLPIVLGTATKLSELITSENKEYDGVLRLGYKTDTDDITGKTIAVKASFDSRSGVIYAVPDTSIMACIYITIISDGSNTDEVLSIKEGETVVVTVDMYDDHLEKSLYIYAKEYKLYR